MNIFKAIYCRTFQFCLKVALPFLPYRNPKVLNKIEDIPLNLKENSIPLIVTDKSIYSLGLLNSLEKSLSEANIKYYIFADCKPNPTIGNANDALDMYKKNNCSAIIAVGGGSSIDCAKAVGAMIAKPKKSLQKLRGILKIRKRIPDLFAIPTTAGTGSETTLACVIVDENTKYKYAINDFPLIPRYAVLDEEMTMTLPPHLVSTTGMDALTHAIEAFIGKGGNKSTRRDSLEAIKLIFDNLENSYFNKDRESRKNMLIASFKAGRAFSKAYVGYVHALAHQLGGYYNTPHGLANSIILPIVLKEYGKKIHKKLYKIALYCGLANKEASYSDAANLIINKIIEMNNKFNIHNHVELNKDDIYPMARKANVEANPLYPVPVLWDTKKLIEMYYKVGGLDE